MLLLVLIPVLIIWGVIIYVVYLLIVALRKYIKSEPVRKEKEEYAKTLGGVIKKHRMECQMINYIKIILMIENVLWYLYQ